MEQLPVGELRRNIVIRGMSSEELNGLVGHELTLGKNCRVFVHRKCVPCRYNEGKNQVRGLMDKLWHVCGVNCEILVGGELCAGDSVAAVPGSCNPSRIDIGKKPPAFFIRPSERTSEQVKDMTMNEKRAKAFVAIDRVGAQ